MFPSPPNTLQCFSSIHVLECFPSFMLLYNVLPVQTVLQLSQPVHSVLERDPPRSTFSVHVVPEYFSPFMLFYSVLHPLKCPPPYMFQNACPLLLTLFYNLLLHSSRWLIFFNIIKSVCFHAVEWLDNGETPGLHESDFCFATSQ
ncbi:hypothetical protein AOLI_G00220430 [Acnodon oligacanthus]